MRRNVEFCSVILHDGLIHLIFYWLYSFHIILNIGADAHKTLEFIRQSISYWSKFTLWGNSLGEDRIICGIFLDFNYGLKLLEIIGQIIHYFAIIFLWKSKLIFNCQPSLPYHLNLIIQIPYKSAHICLPLVFEHISKSQQLIFCYISVQFDNVETLAGKHDRTFFTIVDLFFRGGAEEWVCDWFVGVVGAGEGELPFVDGWGGEIIQIDVLVPVWVHHWWSLNLKNINLYAHIILSSRICKNAVTANQSSNKKANGISVDWSEKRIW